MKKLLHISLVLMALAVAVLIGRSLCLTKPSAPGSEVMGKESMVQLGSALKRFLMFRVVAVDLYVAKGYKAEDVLDDIPKRIEVNYFVDIPKHELHRATLSGIEKNLAKKQLIDLMPKIQQINSYYPSVQPGDQIAVTYLPQVGSKVEVNGQLKGIIAGEDFARAFFSIWVGQNPVDERAKRQLLGLK